MGSLNLRGFSTTGKHGKGAAQSARSDRRDESRKFKDATEYETGALDRAETRADSWKRISFLAVFVAIIGLSGWWNESHRPPPQPFVLGYDRREHQYTPLGTPDSGQHAVPNKDDRSVAIGHYFESLYTIDGASLDGRKKMVYAMTGKTTPALEVVDAIYHPQDDSQSPVARQARGERVGVRIDGIDAVSDSTFDVSLTLTPLSRSDRPTGADMHKRAHVEIVYVPDLPADLLWWNPSRLILRNLRITAGIAQ